MTTLREAAQQALEALEVATNCLDGYYIPRGKTTLPEIEDAITALRAALAEPQEPDSPERRCGGPGCDMRCCQPVPEPVAWMDPNSGEVCRAHWLKSHAPERDVDRFSCPLYTSPPQRPAQPAQEVKGCAHCNHPLYAAVKCRVCGRVTEPVQEPVAWDGTCMLGHCNSPAGCENSGECRVVERAHGIGGEE